MSMISTVITQTELLQEEVYLFEKLYSDKRDIVAHLKAVLIVRPTDEVISFLCKEMDLPKHSEYYLCMFVSCFFCTFDFFWFLFASVLALCCMFRRETLTLISLLSFS
jgi:hypothetical protein